MSSTRQALLFEAMGRNLGHIETEGIKYAGSKLKLIPYILATIEDLPVSTIFDGFSGTTRVSQAFAKAGYEVISNDIAVWSEVFATAYLLSQESPSSYQGLVNHLNAVPPRNGWFTSVYGGLDEQGSAVQAGGRKKPWQIHNTRKLDGIRDEIDNLRLGPIEKAVALSSLMLALDKVDNTLGHYVSYLREWSPRSYNSLELTVPALWNSPREHRVLRDDIFAALPCVKADLAYYDPPYGSNNVKMPPSRVRYASYYHIWKTICLNDWPEVFGAAARRIDSSDTLASSVFEEFRRDSEGRLIAVEAIRRLLAQTNAPYIALSYGSNGIATAEELDSVMRQSGRVLRTAQVDYRRNVMAGMTWTNEWLREVEKKNTEFIFLIEKT